jgi:hypothetical protein
MEMEIAIFLIERQLILMDGTLNLAMVSTIVPACVTYFGGECSYVIELQKLSSAIYYIFGFGLAHTLS